MKIPRFLFIPGVVVFALAGANLFAATSASKSGITWKFDADRPTGQFANGDWWVVAPVKITQILPADSNLADPLDLHGSVLNPKPNAKQGFTSVLPFIYMYYDRALNLSRQLPATISTPASIVSSISPPSGTDRLAQTYAVLTVLPSAPASGSFRPPMHGTNKTIPGNKNALDLGIFGSYAPVADTPTLASVKAKWGWPFYQHYSSWLNTHVNGVSQYSGYGREISRFVGEAALMLNLNFSNAEKEPLLIDFLQMGIDVAGFVTEGGIFEADGGHGTGRKLPMLVAGVMLGKPEWVTATSGTAGKFQEDAQTFIVTVADVGRAVTTGHPYTAAFVGKGEWGIRHRSNPALDSASPTAPYRAVVGPVQFGVALSTRMMRLDDEWAWEPFFVYVDRYRTEIGPPSEKFIVNMWDTYRSKLTRAPRAPTGLRVIEP